AEQPPSEVPVPYSVFRTQLVRNDVQSVVFHGDSLEATLRHEIRWPDTNGAPRYSHVQTMLPPLPDDQLLPLLIRNNVEISSTAPPGQAFLGLLNGLSAIATLALFGWIAYQAATGRRMAFGVGQSRARVYTEERPKATFTDVAGVDEAKEDLQELVDYLRKPERYSRLGARIPHGVLLTGPPGTGKTLLARAVAGEANVPFFAISATEFVEMFVGVGASRVRDLFERAKQMQPSIIFIDEIDAIGGRRSMSLSIGNDEREQTLNQLLVEMDGFEKDTGVIVLAATNRPDILDPALLRPGRFDRQVTIALPDREGRLGILRIHTRKVPLAADVDLEAWARRTPGFSGADLANLVNEAALAAARAGGEVVTEADFREAQERVLLGARRRLVMTDEDRHRVAVHEAGHALVAYWSPNADPPERISIVPHGRALGVTQFSLDDSVNVTRAYCRARLAVGVGGRAAELVVLGDVSSGAEDDLQQATTLARRMVERWGMGEELPPVSLRPHDPDETPSILGGTAGSPELASAADREVQRFMSTADRTAQQLLSDHRGEVARVVAVLEEHESISVDEMRACIESVSPPEREVEGVGTGHTSPVAS
ncbi:MAG TPA: ATP-dependent zinc metalloprotease FtsH, partial [Candidatus Dormibacteraeota bacterium]|nr:ATP-dependent zinc metalloprotease FtsH [Candidatus Dormibacteraeota bacterium]